MFKNRINAVVIGAKAHQILSESTHFILRGITSRGIFLDATNGWMLFISKEKYRGPLTVNIPAHSPTVDLRVEAPVQCIEGSFRFTNSNFTIDTTSAAIFRTQVNLNGKEIPPENQLFLKDKHKIDRDHLLKEKVSTVGKALQRQDWNTLENACTSMLGYGTGLTPEGDDFVLGLLYVLQQIPNPAEGESLKETIESLLHFAYQKTTTLSANLLECAATGQVDERIQAAYLAIITQASDTEVKIQELLGWGNTSGKMVLAGMLSAL